MGMREEEAFDVGHAAAVDRRVESGGPAGPAITAVTSWWNHLECRHCGHTFRRGDRVLQDLRTREVRHADQSFDCACDDQGTAQAQAEDLVEFAEGVLSAWPSVDGVPMTRLGAGDWRTRRPRGSLERARCLYCAHSFRPGELVIVCPCRPEQPRCGSAVHRDPAAGLVCWESWRPDGRVGSCPVTLTRPADDT